MSSRSGADRRKFPRHGAANQLDDDTRRECEKMIDEALDETFPASDPPAYGSLAERIRVLSGGAVPQG